jgi:hypothetical protein
MIVGPSVAATAPMPGFDVVMSDLYFVDPDPLPGQEGAERGVRLGVRLVEPGALKGSIYSAQPIAIDRPVCRVDLLEAVAAHPGSVTGLTITRPPGGWESGALADASEPHHG